MRGIVIGPPTFVRENGAFGLNATLDEQQLRGWLLFWDKLDMPKVRSGLLVTTDVGQFLENMGVLEPTILWPESQLTDSDLLTWPSFQTLRMRDRKQPGQWSLAMGQGSLDVPESVYGRGPGIEVKLLRSLPVPDKDVPLDEILRFKANRGEQLRTLWDAVDDISAEYQDDPKRPIAEMAAIKRFARQAREAVEVVEEAGFPFGMATVAARYTTLGLIGAAASIAFGGGLAEIVGNGILAAGSAAIGDTAGLRDSPDKNPFAYVIEYHSEVFAASG